MPVHTCVAECFWNGGYPFFFFEDVPLVEFMYPVFTGMPGGITVGDSGLCCRVPCLLSTISSFSLLILRSMSQPWCNP